MKGFLKEHLVLIAGLALPLILSAVFFVSANLPMKMFDPPQYSMLLAHRYYHNSNPDYPYRIVISEQGAAELHFTPPEDGKFDNWNVPQLQIYDPKTRSFTQVDLPRFDKDKASVQIIPDLASKKFDQSSVSPDGFTFHRDYKGSGNLMTTLFGGGYSGGYRYYFLKDDQRLPVKFASSARYDEDDFIAWIVEDIKP